VNGRVIQHTDFFRVFRAFRGLTAVFRHACPVVPMPNDRIECLKTDLFRNALLKPVVGYPIMQFSQLVLQVIENFP